MTARHCRAVQYFSTFAIGSLVRVRERDWVVVPSDDPAVVMKLLPLSSDESETVGIHSQIDGRNVKEHVTLHAVPD
jgi:hypothetical protein